MSDPIGPRRVTVWVLVSVAFAALVLTIAGFGGRAPSAVGWVFLIVFLVSFVATLRVANADYRARMAAREARNRATALTMLAATLQSQNDDALRKLVRKPGMVGQAASMILKGREKNAGQR
jgi:nitrate/nitrite transporter NarK